MHFGEVCLFNLDNSDTNFKAMPKVSVALVIIFNTSRKRVAISWGTHHSLMKPMRLFRAVILMK